MKHAVEIQNFSKSYGDVQAVNSISLRVKTGEIYGFLGLNGAGKTTTIRGLLGLISPSAGSVSVLGEAVGPAGKGPWGRVGFLIEGSAYPDLTVRENLDIARRLHGIRTSKVIDEAIEKFSIGLYSDRKAGTLSTGNLQRLGLARATLHAPDLLLLDEPSLGLDPAGVVEIRELLADLAHNQGVTIFMSSHILTEVDRLATRIGIIHKGQLIEDLDKDRLVKFRGQQLEIKVRDTDLGLKILKEAGYQATRKMEEEAILLTDSRAIKSPEKIAVLLVEANSPPIKLIVKEKNLEEYFMQLTGVSL